MAAASQALGSSSEGEKTMHEPPPFRFSVNLLTTGTRSEWIEKVRTAESAGFDVIMVPDHLGRPAPFSSLMLAAEAADVRSWRLSF
jgi:alkanesulfonate monooxygenase SsuD/methylene tetrahydromethanopterin reductase-like flavin-dependent oxidoreductase (luciferase family)